MVVLPLVPIFMVLVGRLTQGRSEQGLVAMQRLGAQVLDLLAGLPTLRAHGRERGPGARVRALGDAHRDATMGTLRIAFLSGMVLELLTTLSVALVAVGIGLRLVEGNLDLVTGIAVLVLAPEVFLPLRQVGVQFHAAADGVAAAGRAFEVLETPVPAAGTHPAPDLRAATLRLDGVGVRTSGGSTPHGLDLVLRPGSVVALTGHSGVGKTTALEVALGLLDPTTGARRSTARPRRHRSRVPVGPGVVAAATARAGAGHGRRARRRRRHVARDGGRAHRSRRRCSRPCPTAGPPCSVAAVRD